MIELLAQAVEAASATGIDWAGISLLVTAIGTTIAAILQAFGKREAAAAAKRATDQVTAVVVGVEAADKGDYSVLASHLRQAGLGLEEEHLAAVARAASKHVKASIRKTALEHNVEGYLEDLVHKTTNRLSAHKLAQRLAENETT